MWADTYYVDPLKVRTDMLMQLTADAQVNQTSADSVPSTSSSSQGTQDTSSPHEPRAPAEGAKVSTGRNQEPDTPDTSTSEKKNPVTIPYAIFNLATNSSIYIPKGAVVAHLDEAEAEMDCFEVAKTLKEAQETIQYRNHLPSQLRLPVPPKSDMICSPAEVKFHRRVELKDHNASGDTKQHFSTNNEDTGRTNLITMDIDTGDSPPSTMKPYTLPLKHYD